MTETYRWRPRWQYLDRDDLLFLFCELKIRIAKADLEDREFPPRLKRQFRKTGNGLYFVGHLQTLEYDDLAYLSRFLKMMAPADVVEARSFPIRMRVHFERDETAGVYRWSPNIRILDCSDVPCALQFLDWSISGERLQSREFPSRLRAHFVADERGAA